MKKQILVAILVVLTLGFVEGKDDVDFYVDQFPMVKETAKREGKLLYVHFTASWCMPCQWMEKNTYTNKKLSKYINEHFTAIKLDIDDEEGLNYKKQFNVKRLPTILVINTKGKLVGRLEESIEADMLLDYLKQKDTPNNRVRFVEEPQEKLLSTPKANLSLSRPALLPDGPSMPPTNSTPARQFKPVPRPQRKVVYRPPTNSRPQNSYTTPKKDQSYSIQVGVFSVYENAAKEVNKLESKFANQQVKLYAGTSGPRKVFRVFIGNFSSEDAATRYKAELKKYQIVGYVKNIDKN